MVKCIRMVLYGSPSMRRIHSLSDPFGAVALSIMIPIREAKVNVCRRFFLPSRPLDRLFFSKKNDSIQQKILWTVFSGFRVFPPGNAIDKGEPCSYNDCVRTFVILYIVSGHRFINNLLCLFGVENGLGEDSGMTMKSIKKRDGRTIGGGG